MITSRGGKIPNCSLTLAKVMVVGAGFLSLHALIPSNTRHHRLNLPVPHYHTLPHLNRFPRTLSPNLFRDQATAEVYRIAPRMERLLYQLPCYCYCDRSLGHTCLLDCFVGTHASECEICQQEAVYAFCQKLKGRTLSEIRTDILRGAWEKVELKHFAKMLVDSKEVAACQD
ncbi:MAG: hypothetical protein EPN47_04795 [Acidobacteria bacterium]|nr:MAG: hypothetical protein EPN47_04795 [Acidobacteriota bacterium]